MAPPPKPPFFEVRTEQIPPVCVRSAYHGHVSSLIDISPYKYQQLPDAERIPFVHVVSASSQFSGFCEPKGAELHMETSMMKRLKGRQEVQRILGRLQLVADALRRV